MAAGGGGGPWGGGGVGGVGGRAGREGDAGWGLYTFDEIEITNPDNTFVVRNADGLGDPMFVDGGEEFISDHMHELSMLYKAMTGTPYYDARPIKYTTWLANPDRRERTRTVEIDVNSIDID